MASRSPRKIGLPVVNKLHKTLTFHAWYPGCPMEEDAYGIPKPKDTEMIVPTLSPRPVTVGLGYSYGWLPDLEPEPHDIALDVLLNEKGAVWPV